MNARHDCFKTNKLWLLKRGRLHVFEDEETTIAKLWSTSNNAMDSVIYFLKNIQSHTLQNNEIYGLIRKINSWRS